MRKITLKLSNLQQEILFDQLHTNICEGGCFMYRQTGHFPRYDCDSRCPKIRAHAELIHQLEEQLVKKD